MTQSPSTAYLTSVRPPSARQRWLARVVIVAIVAAGLVTLAFRNVLLPRVDGFVPTANTVVFLSGATTAVLLFGQFAISRKPALVALATGYLLMGLLIVPHTLSFPGAFSPTGLLGAQRQTTAWLYLSQHFAFLTGAIAYSLMSGRRETSIASARVARTIAISVAGTVLATIGLTWFIIAADRFLPPLMADAVNTSAWYRESRQPLFGVLSLASIAVFWKRPVSMIDLWLRVSLWSWLVETLLTAVVPSRFSLVFYVDRTLGMFAAGTVLVVLLAESLMLHARLLVSLAARRQEHEGRRTEMDVMVGTIAHELRQPLSSIRANGYAGSLLASSQAPDLGQVRAIFDDIGASVVRASDIIESVRATFSACQNHWRSIDMNELVRAGLDLMRLELDARHIACHLDLATELPEIRGHRGQLLQVLVNGMTNAAESIAGVTDGARDVRISTRRLDRSRISVIIEDSGGGVDPLAQDRLFEPFYSTKERGMGIGLSICQSIVAAHRGTVSLAPRAPRGAVLRVDLPVMAADEVFVREAPPSATSGSHSRDQ